MKIAFLCSVQRHSESLHIVRWIVQTACERYMQQYGHRESIQFMGGIKSWALLHNLLDIFKMNKKKNHSPFSIVKSEFLGISLKERTYKYHLGKNDFISEFITEFSCTCTWYSLNALYVPLLICPLHFSFCWCWCWCWCRFRFVYSFFCQESKCKHSKFQNEPTHMICVIHAPLDVRVFFASNDQKKNIKHDTKNSPTSLFRSETTAWSNKWSW